MNFRSKNFYRKLIYPGYDEKKISINPVGEIKKLCAQKACGLIKTRLWLSKSDKEIIYNELMSVNISKMPNVREIIKKLKSKCSCSCTLGIIQKVVNIFFKHLYTFADDLGLSDNDFSECDCPLDTYILKKIYADCNAKKIPQSLITKSGKIKVDNTVVTWSQLDDFEVYEKIQEYVDKLKTDSRLGYDFDNWKS